MGEVQARLLELVDSLPEGMAIPSERELATSWHVARMTLRRAIDELVVDRLLIRHHGRGTYTARPKLDRWLAMTSFSEEIRGHGMEPVSRVLEFYRRRATQAVARRLRIPVGDPVVVFTRLRLADDVPMVVEQTALPSAYVPGLCPEDLDDSLYELLGARYGIEITSGVSTLELTMPVRRDADWLGIPTSQPCMAAHSVVFDARERLLESTSAIYRGDRYAFTAELRMARTTRPGRTVTYNGAT